MVAGEQETSSPAPSHADFDDFFRGHHESLVRFVMYSGGTLEEAHDIVQEVMIQLYRHWGSVGHPVAWLRRAAFTELTRMRGRTARRHQLEQAMVETMAATPDPPIGEAEHVLSLLSLLPERQRQALALTVDGFSVSEISALLDMAAATVRSNLRHARRSLGVRMGQTSAG